MSIADELLQLLPDTQISARLFGLANDMMVPAFSRRCEYVPEVGQHPNYDAALAAARPARPGHLPELVRLLRHRRHLYRGQRELDRAPIHP